MSNLGDSNTPIEGESFGLPAGAELTEDGDGNLAIADSSGSIVLVRDETTGQWDLNNNSLTGINEINAESVSVDEQTTAGEKKELLNPNSNELDGDPLDLNIDLGDLSSLRVPDLLELDINLATPGNTASHTIIATVDEDDADGNANYDNKFIGSTLNDSDSNDHWELVNSDDGRRPSVWFGRVYGDARVHIVGNGAGGGSKDNDALIRGFYDSGDIGSIQITDLESQPDYEGKVNVWGISL